MEEFREEDKKEEPVKKEIGKEFSMTTIKSEIIELFEQLFNQKNSII